MQNEKVPVYEAVSVSMRSYFSITYLQTARFLAERATSIEAEYTGYEGTKAAEHQGAVSASILMSVAAVEAYINEFFSDAADGHHHFLAGLGDDEKMRLARAWTSAKSVQRAEVLEKYQLACMLVDRPPMTRGAAPWQDVEIGIAMRNALMHFKPQSVEMTSDGPPATTAKEWNSIGKRLSGGPIKPNPFAVLNQPDFPYRLLSASCAHWISESARAFIKQFMQHIGVADQPLDHNTILICEAFPLS